MSAQSDSGEVGLTVRSDDVTLDLPVVGAGVKVDHVVALGIGKSAGNGDRPAAGVKVGIT